MAILTTVKLFFSTYRMWAIGIAAAALLGGLGWSHFMAYKAGKNADAAADLKVLKEWQGKLAEAHQELEDERKRIKIEYRDKIKIIRQADDPSGCADSDIPDSIMLPLQNSEN